MNWNLFSFFLNSEESFIEFNTNILETNIINIFLLFGLLFYANKVSFSGTLEERQKEIKELPILFFDKKLYFFSISLNLHLFDLSLIKKNFVRQSL